MCICMFISYVFVHIYTYSYVYALKCVHWAQTQTATHASRSTLFRNNVNLFILQKYQLFWEKYKKGWEIRQISLYLSWKHRNFWVCILKFNNMICKTIFIPFGLFFSFCVHLYTYMNDGLLHKWMKLRRRKSSHT